MAGGYFRCGRPSRGEVLQALKALACGSDPTPSHNRHGHPERRACGAHMIKGGALRGGKQSTLSSEHAWPCSIVLIDAARPILGGLGLAGDAELLHAVQQRRA